MFILQRKQSARDNCTSKDTSFNSTSQFKYHSTLANVTNDVTV